MSRGNHNYSEKGKNDYSTTAANKADVGHTLQYRCNVTARFYRGLG